MRLVHSYSALKLYEQCQLRYYRQRIIKDAHETDTVHITHGNTVHKAIENKITKGTALPKELHSYAGLVDAVERTAKASNRRVHTEQNIGLDSDLNPVGYWDKAIWLRTKVDILIHGGSQAVLMDWKTGKRKLDFTQLKISAISVFKTHVDISSIVASFVWLKDQLIDKATYTREELPSLIDEIKPRLLAIEDAHATNVWTPKPSYLCRYCPCKPTCPYALK